MRRLSQGVNRSFGRNHTRTIRMGRRRLTDEIALRRPTGQNTRQFRTQVMLAHILLILFHGFHRTLLCQAGVPPPLTSRQHGPDRFKGIDDWQGTDTNFRRFKRLAPGVATLRLSRARRRKQSAQIWGGNGSIWILTKHQFDIDDVIPGNDAVKRGEDVSANGRIFVPWLCAFDHLFLFLTGKKFGRRIQGLLSASPG